MVVVVSLASLLSGVTLASMAGRYPASIETVERSAGVLMIAGLALLGSSLPFVP
jgi:hypothetical protein